MERERTSESRMKLSSTSKSEFSRRTLAMRIGFFLLLLCTLVSAPIDARPVELARSAVIRRDTFGVPHILADSEQAAAFAQGYATAEDHFEELTRLFLRARGEQASVFGESFLKEDLLVRQLGMREKARDHFDDLPPHMQAILEGYARGYDQYLLEHRTSAPPWAKPITGVDLLAHCRAVLLMDFSLDLRPWLESGSGAGSNMWVIGRERSASGHGILLANPHLPWSGSRIFHELQLTVPGKINISGATLLGFPVITIGFNENLGWTHTVNQHRSEDVYELKLDPADPTRYFYDGMRLPIQSKTVSIVVKRGEREETVTRTILSCHFGPVIRVAGTRAYAYKSANLDLVNFLTEYNLMAKAESLAQFRAALNMQQLPMFNIGYADRAGNIFYLANSRIPIRPAGVRGDTPVAGDTSNTEWYAVHPITELPQLLNPRGGYLQNTNDAPWYSTLEQRIDRAGFPDYMNDDAGLSFRGQISLRMLEAEKRLTLEKVARLKYNETFGPADRLKADLISLIRKRKGDSGDLREAAEILAHWDNRADVESHGAVLFIRWWEEYRRKASPIFKEPWSAARPLGSMRGIGDPDQALAALAAAVGAVRKEYLSLSVRWGDWHKLRRGNFEVPIGGSFGAFRSIGYRRDATGQWIASDGDSYVLAVEFTDPPTAVSVVAYSESANPESKHFSDQSEIFAHKGYKPVWFTEADIREHLERSYSAPAYTGPESPER